MLFRNSLISLNEQKDIKIKLRESGNFVKH